MRVGGQTLARVATLINSHPRLTGPLLYHSYVMKKDLGNVYLVVLQVGS